MKILHPSPGEGEKVGQAEWEGEHFLPASHLGSLSGAVTLSTANGCAQLIDVTGNLTITLPAPSHSFTESITVVLFNAQGGKSITVSNLGGWVGGEAPGLNDAQGKTNVLTFRNVFGLWIGDGGEVA